MNGHTNYLPIAIDGVDGREKDENKITLESNDVVMKS